MGHDNENSMTAKRSVPEPRATECIRLDSSASDSMHSKHKHDTDYDVLMIMLRWILPVTPQPAVTRAGQEDGKAVSSLQVPGDSRKKKPAQNVNSGRACYRGRGMSCLQRTYVWHHICLIQGLFGPAPGVYLCAKP